MTFIFFGLNFTGNRIRGDLLTDCSAIVGHDETVHTLGFTYSTCVPYYRCVVSEFRPGGTTGRDPKSAVRWRGVRESRKNHQMPLALKKK